MCVYYSICISFDLLEFLHNKLYNLLLPMHFSRGIIKLYLSDISTFDSEFPSLRYENLGNSSLFILTHNISLNYSWQENFLSDMATA